MPPKRKRRGSPSPKDSGLPPGQVLKRSALPGNSTLPWGWVASEVFDQSQITPEHLSRACGLSEKSAHSLCRNKYALRDKKHDSPPSNLPANGELENDVIDISDDEEPPCSKKICKNNPNCLNYLGQALWEDDGESVKRRLQAPHAHISKMTPKRTL